MPTVALPFLSQPARRRARADPASAPYAVHAGCRVTPLLLAADMFPDLERLVLDARRTVYVAFRVFDPATKVRSADTMALGLADWTGLLRHVVENGVVVRILLTDFEPTVAHHLHHMSWAAFRALRAMAETLGDDKTENFEMIIAQHPGELGWALR